MAVSIVQATDRADSRSPVSTPGPPPMQHKKRAGGPAQRKGVRSMCDCTKCTKEHDSPTECGCGRCTGGVH